MRLLSLALVLALVACSSPDEPAAPGADPVPEASDPAPSGPLMSVDLEFTGDAGAGSLSLDDVPAVTAPAAYASVPFADAPRLQITRGPAGDDVPRFPDDGDFVTQIVLDGGASVGYLTGLNSLAGRLVMPGEFRDQGVSDTLMTGTLRMYAIPYVWDSDAGYPVAVIHAGTRDTLGVETLPPPAPGTAVELDPARLADVAGQRRIAIRVSGDDLPPLGVAFVSLGDDWYADTLEPTDGGYVGEIGSLSATAPRAVLFALPAD